MLKENVKPISRRSNLVVQDYGSEILIYDLTENKAFSLNEPSAMIWQVCDGSKTVSEIAEDLSLRLKSPISDEFVWIALEQMKKDNLLENSEEIATDFGGLSRREVIRKVGLATLVALPMVSSLIAPTAAHATSGVAVTCTGTCRCPNGTPDAGTCAGNSSAPSIPVGTVYVNCNTAGGAGCLCRGPFNAPNSGAPAANTLKSSTVGCA